MKGFKNSWIITEEGRVKADLVIENGLINKIGEDGSLELVELPENNFLRVIVFLYLPIL